MLIVSWQEKALKMKIEDINWQNGRIRELRFLTEMKESTVILILELYSDLKAGYRKRVDIKFQNISLISIDFDVKELEANSLDGNIQKGLADATSIDIEMLQGRLQIAANDIEVVRY